MTRGVFVCVCKGGDSGFRVGGAEKTRRGAVGVLFKFLLSFV